MIKSNVSFESSSQHVLRPLCSTRDEYKHVCACVCVRLCSLANDKYVPAMSSESPSREGDPQTEYTTGTDTAYSQTMSIAQG